MLNTLNIDVMTREDGSNGRRKFEALARDLHNYCKERGEELSFETWNNYKYVLLQLPVEKPLNESDKWFKKYQLIEKTLDTVLVGDDMAAKIQCMLEYIVMRHGDAARDALVEMGMLPKVLDVYEMSATMEAANIGITQWRQLVQCFKEYMNIDKISVSEDAWRKLGSDVGEIKTGVFSYVKNKKKGTRKENAVWWSMDPRAEFERNLADFANQCPDFDPKRIGAIQAIYAGDHGQGKHRFACKNVVHMLVDDGNGGLKQDKSQEPHTVIYPLADIKASKDTCEVFKGTIHQHLATGINQIVHGKVLFEKVEVTDKEGKQWKCTVIDKEHAKFDVETSEVVDAEPFMIGDLKYYSQMLGKEDFDSSWCCHCQLKYAEWQGLNDAVGAPWTLDLLRAQHVANERPPKATGVAMKGVREIPLFDIPVENYIWPILHTLIGIGNNILAYLVDYADNFIQLLPSQQVRLKKDVKILDKKIDEERASIAHFDSANTGSGKEMLKIAKRKIREMKSAINYVEGEAKEKLQKDIDEKEKEVSSLEAEREAMSKELERLKKEKSSKTEKLKRFKAARKIDANSLYTGIDLILKKYGINRAEYHGGDLTGVHVKKLMESAKEITDDIRDYLIGSLHPESNETEDSIKETCSNVAALLTLWDAVLSNLHIRFPSTEQCDETQDYISAAIKLSHDMGMSKTVKGHGAQRHVVMQMKQVYGGLPEFDGSGLRGFTRSERRRT